MAKQKTTPTALTAEALKTRTLSDLRKLHADLGLGVTREKKRSWLVERILGAAPAAEEPGAEALVPVSEATPAQGAHEPAPAAEEATAAEVAPAEPDADDASATDDKEGPAADEAPAQPAPKLSR